MQFIILYIGILVFVFYQFHQPPVFHNLPLKEKAMNTAYAKEIDQLEMDYGKAFEAKKQNMESLARAVKAGDAGQIAVDKKKIKEIQKTETEIRNQVKTAIAKAVPGSNTLDKDYVFINFVMHYLPHGIIGLLLAVVFSAAMASMASELNSLASTTAVDIYKRSIHTTGNDLHYVKASKSFYRRLGGFGMLFASIANQAENLIQFVNIIGSLFYGTLLGIFVTAFYLKYVKSTAVFYSAIVAEMVILYLYFFRRAEVAFLLYNIIGCTVVVVFSILYQAIENKVSRGKIRLSCLTDASSLCSL